MYAGFLYRLNYEDYQKREQELDEKIKQLALESDDEDITPVDEAYIIRIGGDKYRQAGTFSFWLEINIMMQSTSKMCFTDRRRLTQDTRNCNKKI